MPSTTVEAQTLPPCNQPPDYVACEYATEMAGYTQTAAAVTPTTTSTMMALAGTQTPFVLLGQPTAVFDNPTCPSGSFETDGLDPSWRLSCSHCLPEDVDIWSPSKRWSATQLAGIPTIEIPVFDFSTFTPAPTIDPSATATFTPSPTFTATSDPCPAQPMYDGTYWRFEWAFDGCSFPLATNLYGGTIQAADYNGTSALYHAGQYNYIAVSGIDPAWHIVGIGAWVKRVGGSANGNIFIYFNGATGVNYDQNIGGALTSWSLKYWQRYSSAGRTGVTQILYAMDLPGVTGGYIESFAIWGYGFDGYVPPTLTATVTNTPAPTMTTTATLVPTEAWVGGNLIPPADCSSPRYVSLSDPIVDIEVGARQDGQCFDLNPELDHPLNLDLQIPRHVVCLQPFNLNVQVLGFQVDMTVLLAAPAFFFIMRWMLRN